jgi:Fanconi-associated nuclease 1
MASRLAAPYEGAEPRVKRQKKEGPSLASTRQPERTRVVPDSDDEFGEEEEEEDPETLRRPTDLEIALPQVSTDQEAIAEYEEFRASQNGTEAISTRLDGRDWVKGKSSIYVDAFNLALETVLEEESHLFDEAERALFEYWKTLSYEAQYL